MTLITVTGLTHIYRQGLLGLKSSPPAIQDLSFELEAGQVLGIIGESGAGKTTLAHCLGGILRPTAGTIETHTTSDGGPRVRTQLLWQEPMAHLNPALALRDHLIESARLHQPHADPDQLVNDALGTFELEERGGALPHQLSGGELRRAGLARIYLARPEVLVADEPTSGLDASLKAKIADFLAVRPGRFRATVLISHDIPVVLRVATHIRVLFQGRFVESCPAEHFRRSAEHPYSRRLLTACGWGSS